MWESGRGSSANSGSAGGATFTQMGVAPPEPVPRNGAYGRAGGVAPPAPLALALAALLSFRQGTKKVVGEEKVAPPAPAPVALAALLSFRRGRKKVAPPAPAPAPPNGAYEEFGPSRFFCPCMVLFFKCFDLFQWFVSKLFFVQGFFCPTCFFCLGFFFVQQNFFVLLGFFLSDWGFLSDCYFFCLFRFFLVDWDFFPIGFFFSDWGFFARLDFFCPLFLKTFFLSEWVFLFINSKKNFTSWRISTITFQFKIFFVRG